MEVVHRPGFTTWDRLCGTVASVDIATLAAGGLDIVYPFAVREVARELALPLLDRDGGDVGLLVGNTRAVWPAFAAALAHDPVLAVAANPLEHYVQHVLAGAMASQPTHDGQQTASPATLFLAHEQYGGRWLPFQQIAVAAGLAAMAPTRLLIHSVYGPWFALRALIVCPGVPPRRARVEQPCRCEDHQCVAMFEHARERPDDWRAWLATRDACPVGREHRYGEQQIAYHYTKDRQYLPLPA